MATQSRAPAGTAWTPALPKCRLCGFDRYHRVSVLRKNGARCETAFFACSRCSVMFLNAVQFDANSTANPRHLEMRLWSHRCEAGDNESSNRLQ